MMGKIFGNLANKSLWRIKFDDFKTSRVEYTSQSILGCPLELAALSLITLETLAGE